MGRYEPNDYVKAEIVDKDSTGSEWLWLLVERSDDERQLIFGTLDNAPVVNADLKLGQQLATGYKNIRDHRKASTF